MAAARLEAHHLGRWSRYVGTRPAGKRIMRCGAGFKPEAVDRATEGNASNMLPLDAEKAVPIRFGACLRSRGRGRVFRPEGMNGPPDCRERGERRGGSEKRMAGGGICRCAGMGSLVVKPRACRMLRRGVASPRTIRPPRVCEPRCGGCRSGDWKGNLRPDWRPGVGSLFPISWQRGLGFAEDVDDGLTVAFAEMLESGFTRFRVQDIPKPAVDALERRLG